MTFFQQSQQAYARGVGTTSTGRINVETRDPTPNDVTYSIGQLWLNQSDQKLWYLNSQTSTGGVLQSDWNLISVASGDLNEINVDTSSAPGTNPVVASATGQITVTGAQVAAGTTANVIRTDSLAANTFTIEIQRSSAQGSSTIGSNGVCHFSSAQFAVDANGFVTLAGGGLAIDSLTPNSGTSPVVPDGAGNVTLVGSGNVTTVGSLNTLTISLTGPFTPTNVDGILNGNGTGAITGSDLYANANAIFATVTDDDIILTPDGTGNLLVNNGDLFVQSSQVGNNLNIRAFNTDATNTASDAMVQTVTQTTGGDPFFLASIDGSNAYAIGIDNSDSDKLKITTDTGIPTPSSGTSLMEMTLTGVFSLPQDNIEISPNTIITTNSNGDLNLTPNGTGRIVQSKSNSGADVSYQATNLSNTASSTALFRAAIAGTTAAAAGVAYAISGGNTYAEGAVGATGNFDLTNGTAPSSGTLLRRMTGSGEQTLPLQPAFFAYQASATAGVTGNGTAYTLGTSVALTEDFDQNGDFNTNGTYTAPVSGKHFFEVHYLVQSAATATSANMAIVTSNAGSIRGTQFNPTNTNVSGSCGFGYGVFTDLDAADTCTSTVTFNGIGADTATVFGGASDRRTWFCGYLAC